MRGFDASWSSEHSRERRPSQQLEELKRQEEALEQSKKRLVRFQKLMRDEQRSRFNDYPVMNNRYLLTHMLGKGGFSEVYKVRSCSYSLLV